MYTKNRQKHATQNVFCLKTVLVQICSKENTALELEFVGSKGSKITPRNTNCCSLEGREGIQATFMLGLF